jgi:hypothetical protein
MYTVHFLAIGFCIFIRTLVLRIPPSWWYDLLTFAISVPASLAAAVALSHFKATSWLVPTGEKPAKKITVPLVTMDQYKNDTAGTAPASTSHYQTETHEVER